MPPWHLRRAAEVVRAGGVIAYPTEAVFGLGCDPWNDSAIERLLEIKRRPARKGLILIAATLKQIEPFVDGLPAYRAGEILASWPGPITWILPALSATPPWLTGGRDTLAVRVTAHPTAAALSLACGMALVSTSANRSGWRPARTALQVRLRLGDMVDYLVPGDTDPTAQPTTIKDAASGAIVRP
jgi:L-threonylcarbamoyladenylate synthase